MKTANLYGCVLTSESRLRLECTAFASSAQASDSFTHISHGRLVRFKPKQIHIAAPQHFVWPQRRIVCGGAVAVRRGEEKTLTTIYEYDGR